MDGSGDGNESSSGGRNEDEDGEKDSNEDGIGEGRAKAKKLKEPHKNCRRDQALSFRTRHHPCRQGMVLGGTRHLRLVGPVSVHAHRTEELTGSKGREGANGVGGAIRVGGGNGNGNGGENVIGDEGGDPWTNTGWERGREWGRKREQ